MAADPTQRPPPSHPKEHRGGGEEGGATTTIITKGTGSENDGDGCRGWGLVCGVPMCKDLPFQMK